MNACELTMTPEVRLVAILALAALTPILYLSGNKLLRSGSVSSKYPDPVVRFQEYLRIRTDHANPDYIRAVAFLNKTVEKLLPAASVSAHMFVPGKPVVIIRIPGSDESLPSVLLSSHMDVVPAEAEKWSVDPFEATILKRQDELRLYARGTQDMKSVGMQYLEALSNLLKTSWKPLRTINVVFVPDEEIGGKDGMGKFVASTVFSDLNVAVALDEGLPHPNATFNIYYGERQPWWMHITVRGSPGHGATLPENTASAVLHSIIDRALAYRLEQLAEVSMGKDIGEVVNVNLAFLEAGIKKEGVPGGFVMNMVPSVASAGFDIRVPPTILKEDMEAEIERWLTCDDGSRCPGVSIEWVHKVNVPVTTSRDPVENPFIVPFSRALQTAGAADRLRHGIFFASTDSRFLRERGIPCFGFSPIERTPNLLHKHDEYITLDGYLQGISLYESIIKELADFNSSIEDIEQWASPSELKNVGSSNENKEFIYDESSEGVVVNVQEDLRTDGYTDYVSEQRDFEIIEERPDSDPTEIEGQDETFGDDKENYNEYERYSGSGVEGEAQVPPEVEKEEL